MVSATRRHEYVTLGCSPRASISLFRAAQASAIYEDRDYVIPDDIKDLAVYVLSHRLQLKQEAIIKKISNENVIYDVLKKVNVPVKQKAK